MGSAIVLVTAAFGLAALIALVFVELRHSRPMLPLRMLRDRLFRAVNIVSFFTFSAFFGFIFIVRSSCRMPAERARFTQG